MAFLRSSDIAFSLFLEYFSAIIDKPMTSTSLASKTAHEFLGQWSVVKVELLRLEKALKKIVHKPCLFIPG